MLFAGLFFSVSGPVDLEEVQCNFVTSEAISLNTHFVSKQFVLGGGTTGGAIFRGSACEFHLVPDDTPQSVFRWDGKWDEWLNGTSAGRAAHASTSRAHIKCGVPLCRYMQMRSSPLPLHAHAEFPELGFGMCGVPRCRYMQILTTAIYNRHRKHWHCRRTEEPARQPPG